MRSRQNLIDYLLYHTKNYFENAEEFLRLEKKHRRPSWFLLVDMWFTPIFFVFSIFIMGSFPSLLSVLSLYRCFCTWLDHYRYKDLRRDFDRWKLIVDSSGGPFVATNDMRYMPYVYADGMQRINNFIFRRRKLPQARPTHSSQLRK